MNTAKTQLFTDHFRYERPSSKKPKSHSRSNRTKRKQSAKPPAPKKPATKISRPRLTEEQKLERRRKRAAERYQQRTEQGLCRTCGREAIPGQTRCPKCAEEHRTWNRPYEEKRRRTRGMQPRPKFDYTEIIAALREENTFQAARETTQGPKRVHSEVYQRQRREQVAKVRTERKSLGLCLQCAEPSPDGETRCGICAEKHRQEYRLSQAKKMLAAQP